jgi:hypothetical protein
MDEIRQGGRPAVDDFATPKQVALRLAISDEQVYRLIRGHKLKAINLTASVEPSDKALWRIQWRWVDECVADLLAGSFSEPPAPCPEKHRSRRSPGLEPVPNYLGL